MNFKSKSTTQQRPVSKNRILSQNYFCRGKNLNLCSLIKLLSILIKITFICKPCIHSPDCQYKKMNPAVFIRVYIHKMLHGVYKDDITPYKEHYVYLRINTVSVEII
jgi:hypothetical protein